MRIPSRPSTLILASASRARRELLRAAGISFVVVPSRARETIGRGHPLRDVVLANARRKALAVARRFPGRWVLGADTLVELDGRLVGKPRTVAEAERLHLAMGGRWHRIATGVCLARDGDVRVLCVVSRVRVRSLTPPRLRRVYARTDPRTVAGGYAARRGRDPFVERVSGSFTNVLGLPMEAVLTRLRALGLAPRGRRSPSRSSRGPSPS